MENISKYLNEKVNTPLLKRPTEKFKKDFVKTEINIERNPIFVTTRFKGNSREIIKRVVNNGNGSEVRPKITIGKIKRDDGEVVEVGVLNTSHLKILYGVLKLWAKNLSPTGEVSFSRNELREIMGGKHGGWVHRRIKQWLFDLFNIPIEWEYSFYDAESGKTLEIVEAFRFFNHVTIYSKGNDPNKLSFQESRVVLNNLVVKNILNKGGKNLRFDVILTLKSEISLLLYRFLDWKMSHQEKLEKDLKDLFEEIGLEVTSGKYKYPSGRKQAIKEVIAELEGKNISTGVLRNFSIEPMRDSNDFKLVVEKHPILASISPHLEKGEMKRFRTEDLVKQIIEVCGDEHSRQFYTLIAEKMDSGVIYKALSETKDASQMSIIKTTKARYFTNIIKRYAQEAGIDLFSQIA